MKSVQALVLIFLLPALLLAQSKQKAKQPLVFTHVTVIDATGKPASPDMTVVITGERISAIGKKVDLPKDAQVISAAGKYLIPGLWDMHAHTSYKDYLALFVANGVTGVRDMGGNPNEFEQLSEWRKQIAEGTLLGPRVVAAGIFIDGPEPIGRPNSMNVANAKEARQAVDYLKQHGADFVKVYSMLSREAYFAVADEARKQRLSFAGHVPASISAAEASDAGQKSMEHLFRVLVACSNDEAELSNETMTDTARAGISVFVRAEIHGQIKALDTYDDRKAAALFARFIKNDTWQVPTLVGWATLSSSDDDHFDNDTRLKYIAPERKQAWKTQRRGLLKSLGDEYLHNGRRLFQKQLELVGAMQRAGVKIMAGTDTAGLYEYPGFSLHEELALLVQAGLTPMQALQAATYNPAKYLGLSDSLGTVEKGKLADLVLLEANPLEDIGNTQKISAVVIGGKLITNSELRAMLAKVEAAAHL